MGGGRGVEGDRRGRVTGEDLEHFLYHEHHTVASLCI